MVADSPHDSPDEALSWRTLFSRLPMERETVRFIFVSALDVFLTYVLIRQDHFQEGNPVARFFLNHWGLRGMVYFKFAMVAFVAVLAQIIARKQPETARKLLNLATVIVICVLIYSLILLTRHGDPLF
jgi:hypothetical protein